MPSKLAANPAANPPLLDHGDERNELLAQSSFENQGKFAKPG